MPYPPITPLPTPPSRSQSPDTFSADADAFLGALPDFQGDANTLAGYLDGVAAGVDADAAAALASQNAAAASAGDAADSAAAALLSEGNAALSEAAAALSESNAAASENAAALSASNAYASELAAASSAAEAEAIVAGVGFKDVIFINSAMSPYTVTSADNGKLLACDTTGGAIIVNLPLISGITTPYTFGAKKTTSDGNSLTINCAGTDKFDDGSASKSLITPSGYTLLPDVDTSPDTWAAIGFGGANAGPVTSSGLTMSSGKILGRSTAGTGAIEELNMPEPVYPGAGIAVSTGSAWGTSFNNSGSPITVPYGGTGASSLSDDYLIKGNGTDPVSASQVFDNGTNVGIGTASPGQKLTVAGTVESTTGGFKFPDGTTQASAASAAGVEADPRAVVAAKTATIGETFSAVLGAISLDANKQVIFVRGTSNGCYAMCYDASTDTLGSPLSLGNGQNYIRAIKVTATTLLFGISNASNNASFAVMSVSGTTLSVGTAVTRTGFGALLADPVQMGSSYVFAGDYSPFNIINAVAMTVSGTTVTAGTAVAVDTSIASSNSTLCHMLGNVSDTSGFVAGLTFSSNNAKVTGFSLSGTTITAGATTGVAGANASLYAYERLSTGRYMLVFYNTTNKAWTAALVSMSGSTPSVSTASLATVAGNGSTSFTYTMSGNVMLAALWVSAAPNGVYTTTDLFVQALSDSSGTLTANSLSVSSPATSNETLTSIVPYNSTLLLNSGVAATISLSGTSPVIAYDPTKGANGNFYASFNGTPRSAPVTAIPGGNALYSKLMNGNGTVAGSNRVSIVGTKVFAWASRGTTYYADSGVWKVSYARPYGLYSAALASNTATADPNDAASFWQVCGTGTTVYLNRIKLS